MQMPHEILETRIFEGLQAEQQLREIGLDLPGIMTVVLKGEYARAEVTSNDPLTFEGLQPYGYRVRGLRDTYCPPWTLDRINGLEAIRSACGRRVVITRGGDKGVGIRSAFPHPKRNVGEAATEALSINANLFLDPNWLNVEQKAPSECETWMLLVYRERDVVRSELSLPYEAKNGRILAWIDRIILTQLDLTDPTASKKGDDMEPIIVEVPVARKQ